MILRREWRWAATRALLLVAVAALPYLIAFLTTPPDLFYTGFLSNPEDGNAYLAKMQQGQRGEWRYRLPYTAEPHRGEWLFTYYILLGHVARWTHLSPILVFHLARTLNGFALLMVLYCFVAAYLPDRSQRRFAFTLTAIGSGLGWIAALLGNMTVDLWVPEGYVFYSVFVNPHFPLAIALMLLAIVWSTTPWGVVRPDWRRLLGLALVAAALGVVQPLCLLSVGVVLAVYALALWIEKRRFPWREVASGIVFGATASPFVVNAYLASTRNPAFAAWSSQNQTLSPPPWDYAVSYGLVLLLALIGLTAAVRRRRDSDWLLLSWTVCTALLLYAPFSLQRRLIMGLIAPLGVLATLGWHALSPRRRLRPQITWALASLTHLFLIVIALFGALTRHEALYITRGEHQALQWLQDHSALDALVIAAPETGLYIPAWTGRRVFYGHRFDTVNADARRQELIAFYREGDRRLIEDPSLPVDYVFYGPRERALANDWEPDPFWSPVYDDDGVTLYALSRE